MLRPIYAVIPLSLLVLASCSSKSSSKPAQPTETPSQSGGPDQQGAAGDNGEGQDSDATSPGGDETADPSTVPGTLQLPESGSTTEGLNLTIPAVEPPVTAATPASLGGPGILAVSTGLTGPLGLVDTAITFSNDGTESGQDCFQGGQYDNVCAGFTPGSDAKLACQFVVDVKCRMFSPGPTYIKSTLDSLDERTAELVSRAAGKRVPCADSTDPNYKLVDLDTNFVNLGNDRAGAPQSLDLGFSYSLSCMEDLGTSQNGGESFVAFGQKADAEGKVTTYVREGNSRGGGSVGAVDDAGNVDFYKTLPEDKNATYSSLQYSAGLIHIKVDAATGRLEMSFTGSGVGPGCGVVMKTDGTYLYAKANINSDLKCNAAEQADAIGSTAGGPNFDAAKVDREFCLKVDQESSMTLTDLQTCVDRSLSSENISITYLKRELLEAIHAAKIFSEKPTGVAAYTFEDAPTTPTTAGEDAAETPAPSSESTSESSTDSSTATTTATPVQYTCSQTHQSGFNKNCSTLFYATSLDEAAEHCRLAEADGGEGCCASSKVFTNAYGPIASYNVKPANGDGTAFGCD